MILPGILAMNGVWQSGDEGLARYVSRGASGDGGKDASGCTF